MGLREKMNQNPGITTGITAGIIVLALLFIIWQNMDSSGPYAGGVGKAYFSDDDGVTTFVDESNKIPPFDHDGKTAYRAYVFRCPNGKPFVQFLERYTPEGKKMVEAAKGKPGELPPPEQLDSGIEVKAPKTGDKGWIKRSNAIASKIMDAQKCPDGTYPTPEMPQP